MPYNTHNYNAQRYDLNGVFHISALSETVTETDDTQLADFLKALSDSLTLVDATIFFTVDQAFFDLAFLDETIQIQFTNKALTDTVRTADWLSIDRNPAHNGWYD